MKNAEAIKAIEGTFAGVSRDMAKLSDVEVLEKCNRLLPAEMQASDLASASRALTAVAAFAVFLTTEIEGRLK